MEEAVLIVYAIPQSGNVPSFEILSSLFSYSYFTYARTIRTVLVQYCTGGSRSSSFCPIRKRNQMHLVHIRWPIDSSVFFVPNLFAIIIYCYYY